MITEDGISHTAAFIAIKFYGLLQMEDYAPKFGREVHCFYNRLLKELPGWLSTFHHLLQDDQLRSCLYRLNQCLLPGDLMHILCRKRLFQDVAEQLGERGYSRSIILGGGLDHLGLRLAQGGIKVLELDLEPMADLKRSFLQKYYPGLEGLKLESLKLPSPHLPGLLENHLQPGSDDKTAVFAAGFFDYLTPRDSEQVLRSLYGLTGKDTVVITTIFDLEKLKPLHRFSFEMGVRLAGERLRLYRSRRGVVRMLERTGFETESLTSWKEMSAICDVDPVMAGFYVLRARKK